MQEKSAILLLSASAQVAESVQEILENEYELLRAKNLSQGIEILNQKKPAIAILDFAAATSLNGDTIEQLEKTQTDLVTLLICPRDKRDQLLESNLSNQAYRVLFATLSPGQTRLAVSAAFKHAKAKASEMPAKASAAKKTSKASKTRPVSPGGENSGSKLIPIIAGVGVIAVAAIGFMFMSGDKSPSDANNNKKASTENVEKTAEQLEIDSLSNIAKSSLGSGILFPPEENNALDAFTKVLEMDPNNIDAKKALVELGEKAFGSLDSEIENGSIADAKSSIATARSIAQGNSGFLVLIENSLTEKKVALIKSAETALNAGSISEASGLISSAKQLFADDQEILALDNTIAEQQKNLDQAAEIDSLVSNARQAITDNRLLAPNRNNAQYFLNRLESIDPSNGSIAGIQRNLSSSLLVEARTATLDNSFTLAKRYVDTAENLGASSAAVNNERTRIATVENRILEQRQAEAAAAKQQAEAELLAETQRLAQEQAAAQAAAAQQAELDRQAEARRLATVPVDVAISALSSVVKTPPVFPSNYQRRDIQGSATIGFTVQRDGSVTDVTVIAVEPENRSLFGDAAQEAVESWSFRPYIDGDGNTRIANSQIKISFRL